MLKEVIELLCLKNSLKRVAENLGGQISSETITLNPKILFQQRADYNQRTDFSRFLLTQKLSCLVLVYKGREINNPESKLSNSRTE